MVVVNSDLPAYTVDCLVAADIDQPCARIGRQIGRVPALQRDGKSFLQCVLGEIEIADETDQGGKRPPRLVAKYLFDLGGRHHL